MIRSRFEVHESFVEPSVGSSACRAKCGPIFVRREPVSLCDKESDVMVWASGSLPCRPRSKFMRGEIRVE